MLTVHGATTGRAPNDYPRGFVPSNAQLHCPQPLNLAPVRLIYNNMGGRFGKYGDNKRLKALQRGRREKSRLQRVALRTRHNRTGLAHQVRDRAPAPVSAGKTYKSAMVVIPPEENWSPIQALRRSYDRHYRRWMPHITLAYPFRPVSEFETRTPLLVGACRAVAPFEIRLARLGLFEHRRRTTLYLIPEPARPLRTLQAAIQAAVPDCDDVGRFAGGYTPHLSVGQVHASQAAELRIAWQAAWRPLTFTVTHACLIWRNNPPDDVFRIGQVLPLGG
jgi:RNA 2',3'-cyclic 3'-phosphodiesterase